MLNLIDIKLDIHNYLNCLRKCMYMKDWQEILQNINGGYLWIVRLWVILYIFLHFSELL